MSYPRPNLPSLIQSVQNYLASAQLGNVGTVPLPNSALSVLGTSNAELAYLLYGYLDYISLQCTPFTCTGPYIDAWANLKGITRNLPTASSGLVSFTGTSGTVIPVNTSITTNDGTIFQTQAAFTIGISATVGITCQSTGSVTNYPSGTTLALSTPQTGVTAVSLSNAITGGTDLETDTSLQSRMLAAYADQPTGGSVQDFYNWSLECPIVTRAWVAPNPSPPNNIVTIYFMCDVTESAYGGFPQGTNGGATLDTRYATATGDQLTLANSIYTKRPVCSIPVATAPTPYTIDLTINPLITTTSATEAAIQTAIQQMLLEKQSPLGMILYESDITTAIATVANVTEFVLTGFTSVSIPVGQIPILGTITYD